MNDDELHQEKILIISDYPHPILMHIRKILKQEKRDFLLQESLFLTEFQKTFPEETREYQMLQAGYQTKTIAGFADNSTVPEWEKRVFIQKSLFQLQKIIKERNAVALLESLMNIFQWNFSVEAKRKWNVSQVDKADFHSFQKPEEARNDNSFHEESVARQRRQRRRRARMEPDALPSKRHQPHYEDEPLDLPVPSRKDPTASGYSEGDIFPEDNFQENDFPYQEVDEVLHTLAEEHPHQTYSIYVVEEGRIISTPQEAKYYSKMRLSDRKHIKKAIAGNEKSQCYLGDYYSEEGSDHLDYPEAVYWYQLSANQGNYKARMQLATIYDSNLLKGKDTKRQGIECYRDMAEDGFPTAQCILGMKYFFGDGVEENRGIAVKWLKKAAAQGHEEAARLLERFTK